MATVIFKILAPLVLGSAKGVVHYDGVMARYHRAQQGILSLSLGL